MSSSESQRKIRGEDAVQDGTGADVTQRRKLWTLDELADYLDMARATAYRLAASGKVPGCQVGGAWRFQPEVIEVWLDAQRRVGNSVGTPSAKSE